MASPRDPVIHAHHHHQPHLTVAIVAETVENVGYHTSLADLWWCEPLPRSLTALPIRMSVWYAPVATIVAQP